jgi:sortase (surface protein transpeptidase)
VAYDRIAMVPVLTAVRTRLLPALLTAMGVVLLTAGLLSYADPTTAGTVVPGPSSTGDLSPVPTTTTSEPSLPVPSASEDPGASASPPASPGTRAVATRVKIPALKIDLPVIEGPPGYPPCNVAMYIRELAQPGEGRATYLYAHARDGMFGPIYERAIVKRQGGKMRGMIVQVYTSDDRLYLYEITEVRLHQTDLGDAIEATGEQLWLQTSEGPLGTPGKTQLIAMPISSGAADPADAHPKAKPAKCG